MGSLKDTKSSSETADSTSLVAAVARDGDAPAFDDPFDWFSAWFGEASAADIPNPNAMSLATVDPDGQPSVRTVLLKDFDRRGFVFYTNMRSRKGKAIAARADVALLFFWRALDRQIRIEGRAHPVSPEEADAYFATRPRESQIGAWASEQSEIMASRAELAKRISEIEARFADGPVARPPHWSGYRVAPSHFEFWAGRRSRLHVRWAFDAADGDEAEPWRATQLYP